MAENQTRILIFSTNYLPHVGGAELALKEITNRLGNDGFEFDLITARMSSKLPRKERIGPVLVHRMGIGVEWLDKLILPFTGAWLGRKLHRQKSYDLVHVLQASFGGIAAYFFKKKYHSILLVLNLQEGKELESQLPHIRFWRKKVIGAADKIVAISKYLGDYAEKLGVESDKIHSVPNGVDLIKFGKKFSYGELEKLKSKLGIKSYDKVIITVSRLEKKNNVESLIEAMRNVNEKFDIKLLVVGGGSLFKFLRVKTGMLGLKNKVIFTGTVEHSELPKYLKMSHIFVRPSFSEGLGTAFLEAMASALPVVGTNTGGIPDFLKDSETGIFCKTEPENIAEKINFLLGNSELRKKIGENAKKMIEEKYNWDLIAEEYKKIYLSCVR